jgi:hypothetical protein
MGAPPRGSPKGFGTPVAKIDSPRGESIMPRYALPYQSEVNCKFAQEVKILSRRAVEPFEVGLTKQLLCVVDPNAGRIGELLIRRSNYKFREIQ